MAAVLALLYPCAGDWLIVYIERPSGDSRDRHQGQIAFPGGQQDQSDRDLAQTALREAHEEIGIPPEAVRLLGALTPLYIPVSNFHVFPFLGITNLKPEFIPQVSEVSGILEISLQQLLDPSLQTKTTIRYRPGLHIDDVPCFRFGEKVIWGATAMITSELNELLSPFHAIR